MPKAFQKLQTVSIFLWHLQTHRDSTNPGDLGLEDIWERIGLLMEEVPKGCDVPSVQ